MSESELSLRCGVVQSEGRKIALACLLSLEHAALLSVACSCVINDAWCIWETENRMKAVMWYIPFRIDYETGLAMV